LLLSAEEAMMMPGQQANFELIKMAQNWKQLAKSSNCPVEFQEFRFWKGGPVGQWWKSSHGVRKKVKFESWLSKMWRSVFGWRWIYGWKWRRCVSLEPFFYSSIAIIEGGGHIRLGQVGEWGERVSSSAETAANNKAKGELKSQSKEGKILQIRSLNFGQTIFCLHQ